jgi:hypothetical protein
MFKLPQLSSPLDFPSIDFSRLDVSALRDAAYLIVGVGVVAVERAQARLAADKTRVETRVENVVDRLESVMPQQAGLVMGQARDITRVAREQVRGLIRSAA